MKSQVRNALIYLRTCFFGAFSSDMVSQCFERTKLSNYEKNYIFIKVAVVVETLLNKYLFLREKKLCT